MLVQSGDITIELVYSLEISKPVPRDVILSLSSVKLISSCSKSRK